MKVVFLFSVFFVLYFVSWAQKITVSESTRAMSLGQATAQGVSIYGVDEKTVIKNFSKSISGYNAKSDISRGEMKASNAKIKSLAADSITIYANTEKISSNEVRLYVFVQHKNQWLNQSSPIVQTINKDLYTFAVNESRKPVEKRIVALTKDIDKYSKHTKEAQKENERLKKEIERCKHVIKNNEEKISENEKRISSNYAETEELKKQLNELQQQLKNIK